MKLASEQTDYKIRRYEVRVENCGGDVFSAVFVDLDATDPADKILRYDVRTYATWGRSVVSAGIVKIKIKCMAETSYEPTDLQLSMAISRCLRQVESAEGLA